MALSPGHQRHPDHHVTETALPGRMTVSLDGELLADSRDVVRVDEDGHPPRYYFARDDVRVERLKRSDTRTHCPFKGDASYYDLRTGQHGVADAVWSYEDPYDEHLGLKGRLAFDERRAAGLVLRSLP
jgi:uncharacterized protein (DUF427 family)